MQRLMALELAADLLKSGHGQSVADYRSVGVDSAAIDRTLKLVRTIARRKKRVVAALMELRDEDVLYLAYLANISVPPNLFGSDLCDTVLDKATAQGRLTSLVGELLRRFPTLVGEK